MQCLPKTMQFYGALSPSAMYARDVSPSNVTISQHDVSPCDVPPITSPQATLPFYGMISPPAMSVNDIFPHNIAGLWLNISPYDIAHLSPCTIALTLYIILQYFSALNLEEVQPDDPC